MDLGEPQFIEAWHAEPLVDTGKPVVTWEGGLSCCRPCQQMSPEHPWTAVLGDQVGSGAGEIDISLVIGLRSHCLGQIPADPVA